MVSILPIATVVLAAVVTIVAVLQWRVAGNKLRLDPFDRRYKIYEATQAFLRVGVKDNAPIETHLAEFNRETAAAEFLFDADVVNYLQQIRERVEAEPQGAAVWL